jgi:pSer/pThr/pTyr-binding forkhead associated (FHA) protein
MSKGAPPLIQVVTPEGWAGLSMNFIDAGYIGLLVKNGQLVRKLEPGRHFSFALPYLEQCQIILVDGKVRSLEVITQGDFVSRDQYLVNVSLSVMYQVVDPKRVALELSDPIAALVSAVKDNLAVVINQMPLEQLNQTGRVQIRDYLLSQLDSFYTLGFNLDDVRVSDVSFPNSTGVIRQLEGLTAKQEADHEARRQAQISAAQAAAQAAQIASIQPTVHLPPSSPAPSSPAPSSPIPQPKRSPLPPTTLAVDPATAKLVNCESGQVTVISEALFTIGREDHNTLVSTDDLCSRNHACIERVDDSQKNPRNVYYQLTDVGSSNGTFLNQQRLTAHQSIRLESGDQIRIGAETCVFEASEI